jgi:hypothetical protein
MNVHLNEFQRHFRSWVDTACKEWEYPPQTEEYYEGIESRLPPGLRENLGFGLAAGIIIANGITFTLKDLPDTKGPYSWFSRYSNAQQPMPNWEYFIQVAEYVRLHQTLPENEYKLVFEDNLMDIGIYRNGELFVCCEVKEDATKALNLLQGIKLYQNHVDLDQADRGNDPLRKAKYIVQQKPQFFSLVAIGLRYELRVDYPEGKAFELGEDVIPYI